MTPGSFKKLRGPTSEVLGGLLGFDKKTKEVPFTKIIPARQTRQGEGDISYTPARTITGTKTKTTYEPKDPGNPLAGIPGLEGPFVAPMSQQEQQLVDKIGQAGKNQQNPMARELLDFTTAGGFTGRINPFQSVPGSQQALEDTVGGKFLSPESNPHLQGAIEAAQRPVIQQFEEQTIPNLRSEFTAAGQMIQPEGSSPFDMAVARAQSGLMNELGDISSQMSMQNYAQERGRQMDAISQGLQAEQLTQQTQQQERSRQMDAVAQGLQMDRTQLENMIESLRASALPRIVEQQGIDAGVQEFQRRMDTLMRALEMTAGVSSPTVATQPGTPGTPGAIGPLAGAAGEIIGML
ncbi:hypothetical protein ACFOW6_17755 [Fodinicurvata halophila]|uniref:Uncharacterized protein n=1 Tax=Fodinicurvata halophila TaxID=1419723 RepID=A0ABV8UQ21_9PROT